MKKTLLFLFAFVLAAVNMVAQNEVVIKWAGADAWTAGEANTLQYVQDPFTVTLAKAEGTTDPVVNADKKRCTRLCQRYGKRGYYGRKYDASGIRCFGKR